MHVTYSGMGGMTEAALTLVKAANAKGMDHEVLFYGRDRLADRNSERCDSMGVEHHSVQINGTLALPSVLELLKVLRQRKPGIVVSHMTQPVFALWLFRVLRPNTKVIIVEHHSNDLKSAKDWFLTWLNGLVCHRMVLLTSEYKRQVETKIGRVFCSKKVRIIPNGIDLSRFNQISRRLGNDRLIGMQARMVDGKDFETLIRSFRMLIDQRPDLALSLELVGEGPNAKALQSLVAKLELEDSVKFAGTLTQEELIRRMGHWDVFVLSTMGETMSRAIMEAQALGLPIVSTEVSGVTASIRNGEDGLLVPPGNPEAMAESLIKLLENSDYRANIAERARIKAVKEFSIEAIWEKYCALIEEMGTANQKFQFSAT